MQKVKFLMDVTNFDGVISKNHGALIKKGTEVEFEETPERVDQLMDLGVCQFVKDEDPGKEDPDQDGKKSDDLDLITVDNVLELNAKEAAKWIKDHYEDLSPEEIEDLYKREAADKNRSTVLEIL